MTKPVARDPIYLRRVFDADIIQLCVCWYITYRLSCRDLAELMAERGVPVAHSTILRRVTRYVPEFEKRWNRFSKPVGTSWRVDETCIAIRGKWHYLYRAVDKQGKTVDFLLRPDHGITAAQAFFRKALSSTLPRVPRKFTLDGHVPSRGALWRLRREHPCWRNVTVRTNKYLNNVICGTTEPSRGAALRWPASSHFTAQRSPWRVSNWHTEFASGNSHSGVGVSGAPCRSNVCGISPSRRAKGMARDRLARPMTPDAPEPALLCWASNRSETQ